MIDSHAAPRSDVAQVGQILNWAMGIAEPSGVRPPDFASQRCI
jgi:hypothetical protein